ncbi:hypothetical protein [Mesorhizobium sp. ESP7-2]|uniref:hypothetical protein n=1 Tax=Mesorhizobium sp. ESP7-2 TaxID=2876622 RepID=UPI001CCD357E|nr:hypothetical protein [Mesorhizobium sp. ESP7-2]
MDDLLSVSGDPLQWHSGSPARGAMKAISGHLPKPESRGHALKFLDPFISVAMRGNEKRAIAHCGIDRFGFDPGFDQIGTR